MTLWNVIFQLALLLAIAILFGFLGVFVRRSCEQYLRFSPQRWLALTALVSLPAALATFYHGPSGQASISAAIVLAMIFMLFALLWLGAVMLDRVDPIGLLVFCLAALHVTALGAFALFVMLWSGAHTDPL